MRGLLMKDLELIKINMKIYLAVFLIGIIYLVHRRTEVHFL